MNMEAFDRIVIIILSVLTLAAVLYAIWHYLVHPFLKKKRKRSSDIDTPVNGPYTTSATDVVDKSLRRSVDAYAAVKEEIGRLTEESRSNAAEVHMMMRELQAKHEKWATDFHSYVSYKAEIDLLLDKNIKSFEEETERFRNENSLRFEQIEARIAPLFDKPSRPWVLTMQETLDLSDEDNLFLEALVAYIESIGPDLPKYLSGIEAAASQLGHFVFEAINRTAVDSNSVLLADICKWFASLHQGHKLKIPVIGDGFDERFHKSVSTSSHDMEAVSIVAEVVNWGLLEVGVTVRTVFKAEVKCKG